MTEFERWFNEGVLIDEGEAKYTWLAAMRSALGSLYNDQQADKPIGFSICNEIEALEKGSE